MRTHGRVTAAGLAALVLGMAWLAAGAAADEKDVKAAMDKLAGTAGKKPDDLAKEAAAVAKAQGVDYDSVKTVMDLLDKRSEGGWGVGKAGAVKPDGIEGKIRDLVKDKPALTKATLGKEADALVELANRTAAVGAVATAAAPKKPVPGKGSPKDWKEYSGEMVKASQELAKAAGAKDVDAVKKAATKLNGACSSCHAKFKD